jgi:tetratricopeptide (TPR) repeat protein
MFRDHLLLGAGPGTYGLLYPSYSGDFPVFGFHAHNGYVQAAVELGLVGLAVLAVGGAAFGWVVWRGYRSGNLEQKLVAVACAGGLVGFLVHNMGDAANVWKAPLAVLAVVAAIAVKNQQEAEQQSGAMRAPKALTPSWGRLALSLRVLPQAVFAMAFVALFLTWGWLDAAHFHYSRSLEAAREGRVEDAVRLGQRAADIDPTLTVYQLDLGVNEFLASGSGADRGLLEDSVRHLRRAVELDPRSAVAHANLARALAAEGQQEEAVAAALRASDMTGADATLLIAAGTILEQLEADQEAVTTYAAAISADFSLVDSTFWTATEFRRLHYADMILSSNIAFNPCGLGSLLTRSRDQTLGEAVGGLGGLQERCAAIVADGPDRLGQRARLAEILMALDRYDEAWGHLAFVVDRQPDLGLARTALGRWYAAQGDLAGARREWLLAGQLSQAEALILLGDTYLPGEVPGGVVARLEALAPVVAGGARRHAAANVYYRMKFGRQPPRTALIPGEWQSALPREYIMAQEALARWRAVPVQSGNR